MFTSLELFYITRMDRENIVNPLKRSFKIFEEDNGPIFLKVKENEEKSFQAYKHFSMVCRCLVMLSSMILNDWIDQYRIGFSSRGLKGRETLPPAVR